MKIAVNKRKSTSLVAGVCTVCIATATGAAQRPAHHESGARVVSQEVALTFVLPVNQATGVFL